MSTRYYGPAYNTYIEKHHDTVLAACCDINEAAAKSFCSLLGFKKAYTDIDAMLDAERPDVVVIVVQEAAIAPLALRVMEKGYPVMMEKPPGTTPGELATLVEAATMNKIPNQVNLNRRFTPVVVEAKKVIEERYLKDGIDVIGYDFWRVNRKEREFYMTAIHGIDTTRFLGGEDFERLEIKYKEVPSLGEGIFNYDLSGTMASGTPVHVTFLVNASTMLERVMIKASGETMFVKLPAWGGMDGNGSITIYKDGEIVLEIRGDDLLGDIEDPEEPHHMGFYEQIRTGFEDIKAGRMPVNDLSSCVQSLDVAWALHQRDARYHNDEL